MSDGRGLDLALGELVEQFINRIAHRQGRTLGVFAEESVTLQQVLLLRHLQLLGESTPSELAEHMHVSLPAVSQMLDRLFVLTLLTRREASEDRRRKRVALTRRGHEVLERVRQARTQEYAAGVTALPDELRADLSDVLTRVLAQLGGSAADPGSDAGPGRPA
jgi:DNA-binding MarR family transcriptional regulator